MYRRLIYCALAFFTVFIAQHQLAPVAKDIKRYNDMRAMSGDPPMLQQGVDLLVALIKAYSKSRRADGVDLAKSLQYDLMRYARISTM